MDTSTGHPLRSLQTPALEKWVLLGALYFSQGLPFGFFTQSLPVVLREEGHSLIAIGLVSLLALPWALKFLWAPFVDRHYSARFGKRRSWILPLQGASVAALLLLAVAPDATVFVLIIVFVVNLLSATQDIATDGLAVDLLSYRERGIGNGLQVAGYRIGMVTGGGALLIFYGELGPRVTFCVMAACIALASVPALLFRETTTAKATAKANANVEEVPPAITTPPHFLKRPEAWGLLGLIAFYKFGDALATGMLRPFLSDLGLGMADLGWLLGTAGFVAGLVGALAGGALVGALGRKRALLAFGVLQALSIAGYALLASTSSANLTHLYIACSVEHFAGGMATAALFTCMMDWSHPDTAASDYTVQASAVVIATGVASALAGFSAQWFGYTFHFALSAALGLAAVAVVAFLFPTSDPVPPAAERENS